MANEQRGGSGNFSQDRERASEAGKKGGKMSQGGQQQQGDQNQNRDQNRQQQQENRQSGQQGGSGNFAQDRERASEAGRKGGSQ